MPTNKQRNLARIAVEELSKNPTITKAKLVEKGRYGRAIQIAPSKVLESKGFKEALAEYGLTEELITKSLVDDIKKKPKRRLGELTLGANILNMTKKEQEINNNTLIVTKIIYNAPRTDDRDKPDV